MESREGDRSIAGQTTGPGWWNAAAPASRADVHGFVRALALITLAALVLPAVHNLVRGNIPSFFGLVAEILVCCAVLALLGRGHLRVAAGLLSASLPLFLTCLVFTSRFGIWDVSMMLFPAFLLPPALILNRRGYWLLALSSLLLLTLLELAQARGLLAQPFGARWAPHLLVDALVIQGAAALAIWLMVEALQRSLVKATSSEEAQREARVQLEATVSALPDALLEVDPEGRVLSVEASGTDPLFLGSAEAEVSRLDRVLPGPAARVWTQALDRATEHGRDQGATYSLDYPEGQRWFELSVARRGAPEERRLVGLVRDVTERVRAEQRLSRLNTGFLSLGADTDENLRKLVDLLAGMLGAKGVRYERTEPLGRRLIASWPPAPDQEPTWIPAPDPKADSLPQKPVLDHSPDSIAQQRGHVTCEVRFGGHHWGHLAVEFGKAVALTDGDNRVLTIVATAMGLEEERRYVEDGFLQAQKMESIGRLAGGVAHDLNNMLAPALGYLDLLLTSPDLPSRTREYLEQSRAAAERARTLVHQLLAVGRKGSAQFEPLDLADLIENLLPMLRRTLREDVHLEFESQAKSPVIRADQGRLEQVLLNLAVNAQDAMPDGGRLSLDLRDALEQDLAVLPAVSGRGRHVVLSVSDTGCGMPVAVARQCFEPFFTTKARGKGTGLGLSTVYGIVQQHEGAVTVQSEPSRGTTFRILLPRLSDEAPRPVATPVVQARPHQPRTGVVLVVEDDAGVRDLTAALLTQMGFELLLAETAEKGWQILTERGKAVDLLVTDVVLPGMNGRQLSERVAERWPDTPILFMSGYPKDILQAKTEGPRRSRFIHKPFALEALEREIGLLLG